MIYERLGFSDSELRLNNHTLSDYLKQTHFLGILRQLFLGTPDCCTKYFFSEKYVYRSVYLPYFA